MGHSHHHHHHHPTTGGRNLLISIVLNILITIAQAVGGFLSGSLSLLSDALHNLSDVLSLVISYIANVLTRREPSTSKTFGYKRAEIIAAFVNSASLIVIAVFLIIEAVERFLEPQSIDSGIVIWLSLLGILANGFSVLLIRKDSGKNMNMRSAYLHLLTDMMASVAVLTGGILMYYFNWFWIDPALTIAIALYLIYMGYDLLRSATRVLMLFSPDHIRVQEIVGSISALDAVKNVHHVHLWQLNEDSIHLEAHIDFHSDILLSEFEVILSEIEKNMLRDYGINHLSIQPEFGKCDSKQIIAQH
ncbi:MULTISPECIES: cation diffusion facilitator family transporter [Robiginitalea]|uniref:cation diffusion facilitator family transporter n=1 Tax=Robiginitalea TaxID=252306 RepID=UPI00234BDC04|nr:MULTISPECIES: cation diffusion facilitator family transporter [unclassified Robiginitalea]MDC6353154.1 cation diffusion facilitator family transporter [Robiginitalea sp. PM2]MDC6373679.1 cation diffusion facilitator family transporter [Robiginitalea sp. SP8]